MEQRFNLDDAAKLTELEPKRIRALIRAGVPTADVNQPPRRRFSETDLRTLAICSAFMRDLGISATDAVEHWEVLMPAGGWCVGDNHISFSVDGESRVRVSPGAIASQIARRMLAKDIADYEALRLAGTAEAAIVGSDGRKRMSDPSRARRTQRLVIPASTFHPQRLAARAPITKDTP